MINERLSRDIVIPEGTAALPAAYKTVRCVEFVSFLVPLTRDITGEFTLPYDEAVELGLIKNEKAA